MAVDFDDILRRIMPLLEKKLNFMQTMADRQMSLEEQKEANKTNLEYRKLEASIESEKDKMRWEKEKLTTTIKGNYDLEMAKQQGLINLRNIDKMSSKEIAEINAASQERVAKYGADAKLLPELEKLAVGQKVKSTNPLTGEIEETMTGGSKSAGQMAGALGNRMGLTPAADLEAKTAQDLAAVNQAKALETVGILKSYADAGNTEAGRAIYNSLDPNMKMLVDPMLKTQTVGAMAKPQAATPPPSIQRTAVQPAERPANPVQPARAAIQQVGGQPVQNLVSGQQAQPTPPTIAPARPELQPANQKVSVETGPLNSRGKTAFGGTPYGPVGSAVESWRNWRDNTLAERTAQEEERRRARRKAQGLNIGGF